MSYIFLRERGEESSAECFSDIPAYVLSRLNLIAEKSCSKGSAIESCPSSQYGTTCEPLTVNRGGEKLTSSAEDSPAKTFLVQERVRESMENEADCGPNLQESLARYDPATHLWRTRQCSLFEGLEECLETFPKAGTMRNGSLWERTTAEPRTDESACGYWRTPDVGAGGEISDEKAADYAAGKPRKSGSAIQIRLCDQVRHRKLWPTPTRCGNYNRKGLSKNSGDGLATAVKTWTIPKCQDSRAALIDRHKSNLGEVVHGGIETLPTKTARLNPNWVEWLMGWPIGWTDLKPLGMDKFRSWRQGPSSS